MAGYFRSRIAQAVQRFFVIVHSGVVEEDDLRPPLVFPLVMVGGRPDMFDGGAIRRERVFRWIHLCAFSTERIVFISPRTARRPI